MTTLYEIRVSGHLDANWSEWLDGMAIQHEANGETLLTGSLRDQSALHGVLNCLRDLGVQLMSVNRMDDEQSPDPPGAGAI